MSTDADSLRPLQTVYPAAAPVVDGVYQFVFIPDLPVQVGDAIHRMDALLCPQEHPGYSTRLFLGQSIVGRDQIKGKPANWTQHSILGRLWHTWSWQGVAANQPLLQILAAHLAALR